MDEQRVKRGAEARVRFVAAQRGPWSVEDEVRAILEAADREPDPAPVWPSDESVTEHRVAIGVTAKLGQAWFERVRTGLRAAMLADPIIRAAVALTTYHPSLCSSYQQLHEIRDAVRASGLTPEDLS